MNLSKFFHSIKIKDDLYAIYNALLMEVLYVNYDELKQIESCDITDEGTISALKQAGIWITDSSTDEKALATLKKQCESTLGIIDIMYLITTQKCNLKCSYCFLENNPHRNQSQNYMSADCSKKAIKSFAKLILSEGREKGTIVFYGGEPLLNKELFFESVLYALEFPVEWDFSIITNGTLLDEKTVEFCKEHHITVGLSIDGPKNIHDKNRKYRNESRSSYDECMASKLLLERIGCNYGLSMTLSQDVIDNKSDVLNWLFDNHRGDVFFNLLHFTSEDEFDDSYIKSATQFMIDFYNLNESKGFVMHEGRIQRQIDSFINQKFVFSDCGAVGCHQITVLPDGNLCICHGDSVDKKLFLGNLDNIEFDSVSDSIQGKKWTTYSTLNDEECLNCPAIYICGRGCPQHAENVFGDRSHKEPNYCYYIKEMLFWLLSRGSNHYD